MKETEKSKKQITFQKTQFNENPHSTNKGKLLSYVSVVTGLRAWSLFDYHAESPRLTKA